MGLSISELTAATVLNDADVFEIEQSGVSKQSTALQVETYVPPDGLFTLDESTLKQDGDVITYNDSDIWVPGATPRWRVVPVEAYTEAAVTSSSTITFAGGGPTGGINLKAGDYFAVGSPVRVVISGNTYYSICAAVTDTLLTIAGPSLVTATAITSLSVGTPSMLKHVQMRFDGTTYNSSTTLVLTKGCQHRWKGATGHLVHYSAAHMNTSFTTEVNLQMNGGSNVSSSSILPYNGASASVYGLFFDSTISSATRPLRANSIISDGQLITVKTPVLGGLADYLVICMTFVVP